MSAAIKASVALDIAQPYNTKPRNLRIHGGKAENMVEQVYPSCRWEQRWIKASESFLWSQDLGACFPLLAEMEVATSAIAAERMGSWQRAVRG